jgi:hypothetical protein
MGLAVGTPLGHHSLHRHICENVDDDAPFVSRDLPHQKRFVSGVGDFYGGWTDAEKILVTLSVYDDALVND